MIGIVLLSYKVSGREIVFSVCVGVFVCGRGWGRRENVGNWEILLFVTRKRVPSQPSQSKAAALEVEFLPAGRIPAPTGLPLACSSRKWTLEPRGSWDFWFPFTCELL